MRDEVRSRLIKEDGEVEVQIFTTLRTEFLPVARTQMRTDYCLLVGIENEVKLLTTLNEAELKGPLNNWW